MIVHQVFSNSSSSLARRDAVSVTALWYRRPYRFYAKNRCWPGKDIFTGLVLIVNFSACDHSRRTLKLLVIPKGLLEVHVEILHQPKPHIDLRRQMRGQPDFVVHTRLLQHEP